MQLNQVSLDESAESTAQCYDELRAHEAFNATCKAIPCHSVWDDHDYGYNNEAAHSF